MPERWAIKVGERTYGPYTAEQIRAFVGEGRVTGASLVARAGSDEFRAAQSMPAFAPLFGRSQPVGFGAQAPKTEATGKAHFIIIADMRTRAATGLEHAISNLGTYYSLMGNVWLLAADQTIAGIRNRLTRELGSADKLFIVDATHDRTAWMNFGPEIDANIRRVWSREDESPQQRKAG